jgi:hypothetical protein
MFLEAEIEWKLRIERSVARTVAKNLFSQQANRPSFKTRGSQTTRSGVNRARRSGVTVERDRRLMPNVLSAEKTPRYPSIPRKADRFFAAYASARYE